MKKFGLIGFPLGHSFSKKYFAQKFEDEQIDNCFYENYPLEKIEDFLQLKNKNNLVGINVTIPYKEKVIKYLDELDAEAQKIRAVNTILFKNGKSKGFNTDIYGFEKSISPLLKNHHKKALILGTGGASKAVKFVFEKLNINYKFVSRTKMNNNFTYEELNKTIISESTIIVNTTPLGTFPNIEFYPKIPYQFITNKHILFDLVYNPSETLFLAQGKKNGATTQNGLKMLELQAEKAWQIWNE